jgi:sulfur-carrier protein
MPTLRIPSPLRPYTSGSSEVSVSGQTVGEALNDLTRQYPELRQHLFNGDGRVRPFVNLYLREENVKEMQGMDTPVTGDDRILLIPSIAGGK